MKIYTVGGSLRDELLGLPVADRDYVVVGATPEELVALGFKPVGRDFPVFLHPKTHEEYALARTERKTARGYHGFDFHTAPDVTLEQDLARRDLTINAIARDADGTLIDPFGGGADLKARVLRHVGPAFVEDPVRILRTARFAARFGFAVAPETLTLMRRMGDSGEVDALVPERVWQEFARGLTEQTPSRMFTVLRSCSALARVLPGLDALFGEAAGSIGDHVLQAVDLAAANAMPLEVRFALLVMHFGDGPAGSQQGQELVQATCERLRVPNDCRELALLAMREHALVERALELRPQQLIELLERADALRKPERFAQLLNVCRCDYLARSELASRSYLHTERLLRALDAARAIDAGAIAARCANAGEIKARVHEARVAAVEDALRNTSGK
jgi:tRNA nucleotidyltransferase (CCA-adding enzyme)